MRAIEQMEQQNAQAEIKEVKTENRKIRTHKKSGINIVEKEEGEHILAVGNCIISEKKFKTETDAIKYIETKPWELIKYYIVIMTMKAIDAKMAMDKINEAAQNQKKE